MTSAQNIQLIDLLFDREAAFLRVWQCEEKIRQILGVTAFPFPEPPDLPSRHKPAKHPKNARKAPQETSPVPAQASPKQKIRALMPEHGENAYCIHFLYNGKEQSSFQNRPALLETLMEMETEDFHPVSIETITFHTAEQFTPVEVLWRNPHPAPSGNIPSPNL